MKITSHSHVSLHLEPTLVPVRKQPLLPGAELCCSCSILLIGNNTFLVTAA